MTTPLRPVPAPGPTIPGRPIRKLPPFVTDTLFPVAGGPVAITRSRGFSPLGPDNEALTMTPPPPQQGDTAIVFYKEPTDHVFAHEIGHLLDHRGTAGQAFAQASTGQDFYRHPNDYFGRSRDEYVAEAFARAMESSRRGFADSARVERDFPGSIAFIRWLQTRRPFARDSLTKDVGRVLSHSR